MKISSYFKYLIIAILCLVGLISLFSYLEKPIPKATVIFNKFDEAPPNLPKLFYSDITLKNRQAYTINETTLDLDSAHYTPYTEGFIETSLYEKIYLPIKKLNPMVPTYFHDYFIFENLAIACFSGGLDSVYIVDMTEGTASPLIFDPEKNLGDMYVSHMEVVGNTLILLGGKANDYASLIYTVDLNTYKVTSSKYLKTHPSALYQDDFTILSSGECIFIAADAIERYNPFLDTLTSIPLPFSSTRVLAYENTGLVFGETPGELQVYSLDDTINITLRMPVSDYRIVDLIVEDGLLYVALFDPSATLYTNYLCIYDLKTGEWMYTLGLENPKEQALLYIF